MRADVTPSEYSENPIPTILLIVEGKTSYCYKFYIVLTLHLQLLII